VKSFISPAAKAIGTMKTAAKIVFKALERTGPTFLRAFAANMVEEAPTKADINARNSPNTDTDASRLN
ncbi:MAG: hypothetical protein QXF26_08940, partial [Candidatus Bathyarchaeia archaeon]